MEIEKKAKHIEPIVFVGIDEDGAVRGGVNMRICPATEKGKPVLSSIFYEIMKKDIDFTSCIMDAIDMLHADALASFKQINNSKPKN